MKDAERGLKGPVGIIMKFIGAAFFGSLISLILFLCTPFEACSFLLSSPWIHIFWIIPVVWGVFGIFWFELMLDIGGKILKGIIDSV